MPKVRKLSDLYVVGQEVTLDDGDGAIKVWVQKMSPIDHETALRRANARRAGVLSMNRMKDESNTEDRNVLLNQLYDLAPDTDSVIDFLVADKVSRLVAAREDELASEEEWSKDDYIQGLRDSWNDDMYERFVTDPDDEEALGVKNEIDRFNKTLEKILEGEKRSARKEFVGWTEEKLVNKALEKMVESEADMAWLGEYRKCELWLGVRVDEKTKLRYFDKREEIDQLSAQVLSELMQAYQGLNVDVIEGKD